MKEEYIQITIEQIEEEIKYLKGTFDTLNSASIYNTENDNDFYRLLRHQIKSKIALLSIKLKKLK